jgi:5-hydroxyisourate hydrolase
MSGISTHILDTSRGVAAQGVAVTLDRLDAGGGWKRVREAVTDADGRVKALLPAGTSLDRATYRLRFESGAYFAASKTPCFFPHVEVAFTISDPTRHHHVPLLLSPFGYSTYRGT